MNVPFLAVASFDVATLVLGGLLMAGALASGLVSRSFLSLTAAFVLAGFLLGQGGLGVLEIDPRGGFVHDLAIVTLIVILFRDGLEVEAEMLQTAWRLPLRKLALAMPLTCVIVALATHWLTGLGWAECFLVGALLSPTDPVLSSTRHARVRHPNATLAGDPGASAVAVRAWRRVRDLRRHGCVAAGGQRADRGLRVRDHARHPPPRPAPNLRGARRRHRRDRQARRIRRLRLPAHPRRALRRRMGGGCTRRDHAADRATRGDRGRAAGHKAPAVLTGLHGLVRARRAWPR